MILAALIWYKIGTFAAFILLGFAGGIITGVRVAPPKEDIEIEFGKIKWKLKGRKNNVTDGLDVTNLASVAKQLDDKKPKLTWKERRAARKERKNK